MHEERRDHITRSFVVTANRRGPRRVATVSPRDDISGDRANVSESGRTSPRRHPPRVDGCARTVAVNGSPLDVPAADPGDLAGTRISVEPAILGPGRRP
jgi:hypothetical protein